MFFHRCTLFDREGTVAGLSGRVKRGFFDRLGILRKVELPFDALLSDQVKTLVDKRPELLVGYPSRLYLIACYLRSHHVRVVPPKAIFADSETLFPFMRETIEQAFRVRVTNLYDSYEFGYTAWECSEHDGLHINSDHQIVQITEDEREVEDGHSGDIVTTDLDNYAMPLIRYDTFDVGAKSKKKCKCGLAFPMLESVAGRKWDFLVSPSGETIPPLLVEQFIRKSSDGIEEYQITQNSRETLHIDVVVSNDYDYGADTRIKTQLQDLYHFRQIYVHHPSHVKRTRSGKWRCVVRNC
jgi:phenylacetate-CoA ligase